MYDGSTDCRSSLASEKSMMDRLQKLNLATEEWEYIEAAAQKKERNHLQNIWQCRNEQLNTIQQRYAKKRRNRKHHACELRYHKQD